MVESLTGLKEERTHHDDWLFACIVVYYCLCALSFLSTILISGVARYSSDTALVVHEIQEVSDEPPSPSSLQFVAIGDWGAPLTSHSKRSGQLAVADGIASYLQKLITHDGEQQRATSEDVDGDPFILSLGDNFYPNGVTDLADMEKRFTESLENVYSHEVLEDMPWYAVAGNHDYKGDVSAQIQYSSSSSRWNFPDYHHRIVREVPLTGDKDTLVLEILAVDTMQLSIPAKNSHGLKWIEKHLLKSDADYLIVAGHYPAGLVPGMNEVLKAHHVSAYVSGHIHCQMHKQKHGVHHFITGAGMGLKNKCHSDKGFAVRELGFLSFDIGADKMVVRFRDQSGSHIHNIEINPRTKTTDLQEALVDSSKIA